MSKVFTLYRDVAFKADRPRVWAGGTKLAFSAGKITRNIIAVFVLLLFVGFAYLAITGYLSDSEIWAVTLAKNFRDEWHNSWFFTRPLFYLPLGFASYCLNQAAPIFLSAKIMMLLNAALMLYFTFRLTQTLVGAAAPLLILQTVPWIAVFYLLGNTGFLNQGYRIRSDLFSATFTLLALNKTLSRPEAPPPKYAALWLVPLLCTPKAFLHIAPALVLLRRPRTRNLVAITTLGIGIFSVLAYPEGLKYLSSTIMESEVPTALFSQEHFFYLERVFSQNQIWFTLFLTRMLTFGWRISLSAFQDSKNSLRHQMFATFSGASFAILAFYPEKVPFFIAFYLPLACVNAALIFDDVYAILPTQIDPSRLRIFQRALWVTLLVSSLSIAHNAAKAWLSFREDNNAETQLHAIDALEALLNEFPGADYYDVVGLIPQRATHRYFAGPNDPEMNQNTMRMLDAVRPNLFFYVRKAFYLEPRLSVLLKDSYFEISNTIFARWDKPEQPIQISAPNRKKIESFLNDIASAVGRPGLSRFSLLIQSGRAPPKRVEMSEAEFLDLTKTKKKSLLLAASPFTLLRERPGFLPSLIRFDWE